MLAGGILTVLFILFSGIQLGREKTAPEEVSGAILYQRHCAACHGEDGRGAGSAADIFKIRPTDLTRLKVSWGKKYSIKELARSIDGSRTIRAHGSSQMPIWGRQFEEYLEGSPHAQRTSLYHTEALAEYLNTLQLNR